MAWSAQWVSSLLWLLTGWVGPAPDDALPRKERSIEVPPAWAAPPYFELLDAENRAWPRLPDGRAVLPVSKARPDDAGLPRGPALHARATDPDAFRLEVRNIPNAGRIVAVDVCAGPPPVGTTAANWPADCRGFIGSLPCFRFAAGHYRCPFLRLVTDEVDATTADASGQLLLAALGDRVAFRRVDVAGPPVGLGPQALVGRRDAAQNAAPPLTARLRLHVLRRTPGGPPAVADAFERAAYLAERQVSIANERWAQCGIRFETAEAEPAVQLVDPPGPVLLSVANETGALAAGGRIRLRADDRPVGPIDVPPGATPQQVAERIAAALAGVQLRPTVSPNPKTTLADRGSVDVLARRSDGQLVEFSAEPGSPLTTDSRQSLTIGRVDLRDGVEKFGAHNSNAGTLEERTLFKALSDADPATIEVFLLNRFTNARSQAETFIEADNGPVPNLVLLSRAAVAKDRASFALAHEFGHILLDVPGHPDSGNGPDTPTRLMDADASSPTVGGPKRLTADECALAVRASGPDARPAILRAAPDVAVAPPPIGVRTHVHRPFDPAAPLPPEAEPPASPGRRDK